MFFRDGIFWVKFLLKKKITINLWLLAGNHLKNKALPFFCFVLFTIMTNIMFDYSQRQTAQV